MLDVCGHGVAAALISVSVSQFLQNVPVPAGESPTPGGILEALNRAFPFERFDSYFSIVYMVIDPSAGTLSYSNAGHPPPLFIGEGGEARWLDRHGPVIGLSDDQAFTSETLRLDPADRILVYTDGVLEMESENGGFFGKERLSAAAEGAGEDARRIVDAVYDAAKEFGKNLQPEDDLSLLAVSFTGEGR